jgi:hypothetical protein
MIPLLFVALVLAGVVYVVLRELDRTEDYS